MSLTAQDISKTDVNVLAGRVKAGDVRTISRLITWLENQEPLGTAVLRLLDPVFGHAVIIGVTGYPGAGKSTLIDQLVAAYRRQGRKVGIIAVDTSSPRTGGALLGDRIRMQLHALDAGVYIRSMATRGQHGGLASSTRQAVRVLDAAGYDVILVETIGVGQNEVEIAEVTPTVVAVLAPGLGDEIQAMKAGLLEIAHIVVVNKADRDGADATIRDLQTWFPTVLRAAASKGEGIPELMAAIAAHQQRGEPRPR
jgi:LAO/AO transport system kinase